MQKQISFTRLNFLKKKLSGSKLVSLIFGVLVICFLAGFYIHAAWTEPSQSPPDGNVYPPVNVGPDAQAKSAGLILNNAENEIGLIVKGATEDKGKVGIGGTPGTAKLYVNGNIGVGVTDPTQKLDVAGAIEIGDTSAPTAGAIRWTGTDFEGYTGTEWKSLTSGGGTGGELPSGTVIIWTGASCPPGYTRFSEIDGKFLVGGSSYNPDAGGNNTQKVSSCSLSGWCSGVTSFKEGDHRSDGTMGAPSGGLNSQGYVMDRNVNIDLGTCGGKCSVSLNTKDNRPEYATVLLCKKD